MQRIRLLIINNNQAIRRSMASLFSAKSSFEVVDEIDSAVDVEHLSHLQPDIVFYGLSCPDEESMTLIGILKEVCPFTLVIVFTELSEKRFIRHAFTAGADGYLLAPILPADLVTAIELTCRCSICFFPRSAREVLLSPGVAQSKPFVEDI